MISKLKPYLYLFIILFLADFASKYWVLGGAVGEVPFYGTYRKFFSHYYLLSKITSFFNIILVWNDGVSFSLFSSSSEINRIIILAVTMGIVGYLIYLLLIEESRVSKIGITMIISGAIGNIFDRIRYGAVIDFLDFHIKGYHWPAFNMADVFICIGVGLLIIKGVYTYRK